MDAVKPIDTLAFFPVVQSHLVELLRGLSADDWQRPTICKGWSVKDIAAHLLDVDLRLISLYRDHYSHHDGTVINSYQSLVGYLNQLNHSWVVAARRLSPAVITDQLAQSGPQIYALLKELPPFENAVFSVAWAGEDVSPNWFHVARQYTEIWHHQQQIRLAVGQTAPLMTAELYYPLLDTFARALPHTYREVDAKEGTVVKMSITGNGGDTWYLCKQPGAWQLFTSDTDTAANATIIIDGEIAWRLFTKGITRDEALNYISISGDERLALPVLGMLSVMA
ncbi:maleylpyruvate isomerase N-terminal domain-containing protein [Mucilaginibacter mali]|uniref:Maleylpyruvate isomerase N-terminal domain-containing protein n=1 Tax=Mucilaginibacter mali TaxID=2740462 RepID=A0A7D4UPS2_9SPHI|nr:maleylpyruvate isomerase N-terminal domain-containing protein [Mucilaginibacter mali]QKJ31000.1 maleylpyruvate isomerase N-terminal domain-containing protein [Mucilaginibacter mali]